MLERLTIRILHLPAGEPPECSYRFWVVIPNNELIRFQWDGLWRVYISLTARNLNATKTVQSSTDRGTSICVRKRVKFKILNSRHWIKKDKFLQFKATLTPPTNQHLDVTFVPDVVVWFLFTILEEQT
jgi:hypothetical protein